LKIGKKNKAFAKLYSLSSQLVFKKVKNETKEKTGKEYYLEVVIRQEV